MASCGTEWALCPTARGVGQLVSDRDMSVLVCRSGNSGYKRLLSRGNHRNHWASFCADRGPHFVENLTTYHVLGSLYWRTCVYRRHGSGRSPVLCLCARALALE